MRKARPYSSGADFWKDLVKQFGRAEAFNVAKRYLECPVREGDEEEHWFRLELRDAMLEN